MSHKYVRYERTPFDLSWSDFSYFQQRLEVFDLFNIEGYQA